MHTYRLKGASGKVANQSFGLEARTVIGCSADCELVVEGENVAQRHAEIVLDPAGGLILKQLDSQFETLVNGIAVEQAQLASGDEIRVGNCRWVLQAPGLRPEKILTEQAVRSRKPVWGWVIGGVLVATAAVALAVAWHQGWLSGF